MPRWPGAGGPWAALLMAAVCLAVYGNTLRNGFVWDDQVIIVENPATRQFSRIGEVFLSPDEVKPYYRPLNRASYLLDHRLFGLDPRAFHFVNIVVHTGAVLLLLALGRRVFPYPGPALLAAALLAVHPIHSEAVNFISGRNNLWALLFSLGAVVLFVDANRRQSRCYAVLSGVSFFLGLLSKEQAFMVLPLMALWATIPELSESLRPSDPSRPPQRGWGRRQAVMALAPHVTAFAVYLFLRSLALGGPVASAEITQGLPERIAQNYHILPRYLALVVFPRDLTIFHAPAPQAAFSPWWLLLAWLLCGAVVAWFVRWRSLPASVGLLWFGLNLLPISNIVPIPSAPIAERYFYLPAAGLWLVAAEGVRRCRDRVARKAPLVLTVAVVLAALATRTVTRNLDWRDDVSLARSATEASPGSVGAHLNLGEALKERGDLEGARRAWQEGARIDPGNPKVLTQLGTLEAVTGDLQKAESLLRRALQFDPSLAVAHFNLGKICEKTRRSGQALRHYERFLQLAGPMEADLVAAAQERVRVLREAVSGGSPGG